MRAEYGHVKYEIYLGEGPPLTERKQLCRKVLHMINIVDETVHGSSASTSVPSEPALQGAPPFRRCNFKRLLGSRFLGGGCGIENVSGNVGLGGGAVRIICSGTLSNSGNLDAQGEAGNNESDSAFEAGGGGGGGGEVILASTTSINQAGTIDVSGGSGGAGDSSYAGGYGGGGGLIRMLAPSVTNSGQNLITSGTDGTSLDPDGYSYPGGASAGSGGGGTNGDATKGLLLIDQCNPAALLGN